MATGHLMELCAEDTLKLNVLLANSRAVRINEQTMCVHGMTDGDDAKVELNSNCPPHKYLRLVREMLSTKALGSPRGYPVYLRRWTRMGDMQNTRLEPLLMLAEDEAVIAVARAAGLTDDLAARIWWVLPTAEVARYMLEHPCVVHGAMGPILAEYLIEYLPFEEVPGTLIETVRLILQPGLINDAQRRETWQRGARKNHYYVGFLQATPDGLPDPRPARDDYQAVKAALQMLSNDPMATQLIRVLSASGQTFLSICERVLSKAVDQDVVVELLDAMYRYFGVLRTEDREFSHVEELEQHIESMIQADDQRCAPVRQRLPELESDLKAMLLLAHSGEPLVRPIFARTDAIGSLMRKKIAPVANAVLAATAQLLRRSPSSP
jgi:hypothetical protein